MPETEFARLTLAQFKAMPDAQAKATLKRMSRDQVTRWLDRASPSTSPESNGLPSASNVIALRRASKAGSPGASDPDCGSRERNAALGPEHS